MSTDTITPSEAISTTMSDVKSSLGHVANSLGTVLEKSKTAAIDQFDAGREAVSDYARENPLRTVGFAALAGLALGVIFFRR